MIELIDYEVFPRDSLDGRKIHYYFSVNHNGEVKENYAFVVISGTAINSWVDHFKNSTEKEYNETLAKIVLKLIEPKIKSFSIQTVLSTTPIKFNYWSENTPLINFDPNDIQNIEGYRIHLNEA